MKKKGTGPRRKAVELQSTQVHGFKVYLLHLGNFPGGLVRQSLQTSCLPLTWSLQKQNPSHSDRHAPRSRSVSREGCPLISWRPNLFQPLPKVTKPAVAKLFLFKQGSLGKNNWVRRRRIVCFPHAFITHFNKTFIYVV